MSGNEVILAKLRAKLLADKEDAARRLAEAAEHGIELSDRNRSVNLYLLRVYLNATQTDFAALVGNRSQSEYSRIETGAKLLTVSEARQVERDLAIPENWLDRSNGALMFLSLGEFALVNEMRRSRACPDAALALAKAVRLIAPPL